MPQQDDDWVWKDRAFPIQPGAEGPGFLCVPQECVVRLDVDEDVRGELEGSSRERRAPNAMGCAIYTLLDDVNLLEKIDGLRGRFPDAVGPHYVFRSQPWYEGGPAGDPAVAGIDRSRWCDTGGDGTVVAVLDTGVVATHPDLAGVDIRRHGSADDVVDENSDDFADHLSGHGTMIAGIYRSRVPECTLHVWGTLDSHGFVTEEDLCRDLAEAIDESPAVINLSLGTYTLADQVPIGLLQLLMPLTSTLVVAAAGNAGITTTPFYPAALDLAHVVGVGAVDPAGAGFAAAPYTNSGAWVGCCAPGGTTGAFVSYDLPREGRNGQIDPNAPSQQFDGEAGWQGTSFAAPLVGAWAAMLASRTPNQRPFDALGQIRAAAPISIPNLGRVLTDDLVDSLLA